MLASRKPAGATVMRTAGMLYQERGKDSISNLYRIKLINKTTADMPVTLRLEGTEGRVELIGNPLIRIKAEGQGEGTFFIVLPRKAVNKRKSTLKIGLYEGSEHVLSTRTTFLGPVN